MDRMMMGFVLIDRVDRLGVGLPSGTQLPRCSTTSTSTGVVVLGRGLGGLKRSRTSCNSRWTTFCSDGSEVQLGTTNFKLEL
eukprot:3468631-Rhodomonas_salina.1